MFYFISSMEYLLILMKGWNFEWTTREGGLSPLLLPLPTAAAAASWFRYRRVTFSAMKVRAAPGSPSLSRSRRRGVCSPTLYRRMMWCWCTWPRSQASFITSALYHRRSAGWALSPATQTTHRPSLGYTPPHHAVAISGTASL